jgi:GNAT superfamily N-acetyltransferase
VTQSQVIIQRYTGDAAQLAAFMESVWADPRSGTNFHIEWSESYLEWQLYSHPNPERVYAFAAYSGDQLVGFFGAEEFDFQTVEGCVRGTMGSWLTVDPKFQRCGIATKLFSAMWTHHRLRGARFQIGFVNAGDLHGAGSSFWRRMVPRATVRSSPAFWGVCLRPGAVVRTLDLGLFRSLALCAGSIALTTLERSIKGKLRRASELQVRAYTPEDLTDCLTLIRVHANTHLGYIWQQDRLAVQLASKVSRTYVLSLGGSFSGFCNWHVVTVKGLASFRCAVIDFCIVDLKCAHASSEFLRLCVSMMMQDDQVDAVVILGPPIHEEAWLSRAGFFPLPIFQLPIYCPIDLLLPFTEFKTLHFHCR